MKNLPPERWQKIEALLDLALERPASQRRAFLDDLDLKDPALYKQLEALLAAGNEAEAFLEDPAAHHFSELFQEGRPINPPASPEDREGQHLGPYKLLRPIGRGGMGQVYLAVRDDAAFKQYVAVKVIRRGMDTEDILRRFRTERQILASLNHPNIARLLDGGATDDGLSYFVMEYIEGKPLLEYCDQHRLPVEARLQLFRQVCAAVHYAHQNLIVHRDLKPSNILVTNDGVPKLLDFGIAKFLNPNLSVFTAPMTRTELRVMTPEYASPEQVRGENVTTASDVYALGVLLYELLTGRPPYRLTNRGRKELEAVICETDPERPSTIITRTSEQHTEDGTTTTVTPESIGQARGVPADRLQRRLSGDLDKIVLMTLRKEPERRYASAEALQEDLKRHLEGLPVVAQRSTFLYRTRKFVLRHRVGVAAVSALVVLLLSVVVLSIRFAIITSKQSERIALEAAKARQVKDLMIGLFEESDPDNARGEAITAREVLSRGAEQIERELADQPELQAEMLHVMGVVYRQLGNYEKAESMLERSLAMHSSLYGPKTAEVAENMYDLGTLWDDIGRLDEAEQLLRDALALQRTVLGSHHAMVAKTLNNLGVVVAEQDNYEEAEQHWREALEIQRSLQLENKDLTETMSNLAIALHVKGASDEAEQLYREALTLQRKLLGHDHPIIASSLYNLGTFMVERGAYIEAELFLRDALARRRKFVGEAHPAVANTLSWLGRLYYQQNRLDDAEPLYREALALHLTALGNTHPYVGRDQYLLAVLLTQRGAYTEAEALLKQSLAIYRTALDNPDHYFIQESRQALDDLYQKRDTE